MGVNKSRNWGFVAYPESLPEKWENMLIDTHIPTFISPLHDRDTDENGEVIKAHYHIVLMFDGPITQKRANELIEPFCGTKSAEYIKSLRGYVRYLAHLDNPDKAQYDPAEIIALNGADLADTLKGNLSDSDKYRIIGEVMRFCEDNAVFEFSALVQYAVHNKEDWLPIIVNKAYFVSRFMDSLRHSSGHYIKSRPQDK